MGGDVGVGKTSLVRRMVYDMFEPATNTTVGLNFERMKVETELGTLTVDVYDVPGSQERKDVAQFGMRGASAALLCFTSERAFAAQAAELGAWIEKIRDNSENCEILLVLTKSDELKDQDVYEFTEDCDAFIKEKRIKGPVMTSAKNNSGIDDCKKAIAVLAHQNWSPNSGPIHDQGRCRC